MGINALTQIVVPPPKYCVDRLVPCRLGSSTRVRSCSSSSAARPASTDLDRATTLDRMMLDNTDDAYGFPPFRYLAPAITIGGVDYPTLREREREILTGFLAHVRAPGAGLGHLRLGGRDPAAGGSGPCSADAAPRTARGREPPEPADAGPMTAR